MLWKLFEVIDGNERLERELLSFRDSEIVVAYMQRIIKGAQKDSSSMISKKNEDLLLDTGLGYALTYWVSRGGKFSDKKIEERFRKEAPLILVTIYDGKTPELSKDDEAFVQGIVDGATVEEMYGFINGDAYREKSLLDTRNMNLICGYFKLGHRPFYQHHRILLKAGMEEALDIFVKTGAAGSFSREVYAEFVKVAPRKLVENYGGLRHTPKDEDLEFHEESLSVEDVALLRSIYDGTYEES